MDELSDAYGEEFASNLQDKIRERQQERESLSDTARAGIANKAINEQAFDSGDPMFQYQDPETGITHDVLLMEVPDPESKTFWSMKNELDSGAVSLPLLYLGEFMSCLFNDKEEAKKLEPGNFYIVSGRLSQWEDDQGRMRDQVQPVRGVMDHEEAKKLAEKVLEDSDITEPEQPEPAEQVNEPEPEPEEEEDEDESSGGGVGSFALGDEDEEDDEDELVTQDEIDELVEGFAEQEEAVWELNAEDERFEKLVQAVTHNHENLDFENEDHIEEVAPMVLDRIEREQEDEEDDDDDDGESESLFQM